MKKKHISPFIIIWAVLLLVLFISFRHGHAFGTTSLNCLDSKAFLKNFSIGICAGDDFRITGSSVIETGIGAHYADFSLTAPEIIRLRFYVVEDGFLPPQFASENPKPITSPDQTLAEIEQQYKLVGIARLATSSTLSVNGTTLEGFTIKTSSTNYQSYGHQAFFSYWSFQLGNEIIIIETELPWVEDGREVDLSEKYQKIRINLNGQQLLFLPSILNSSPNYQLPNNASNQTFSSSSMGNLPFPSWWSGPCNVNNHKGSYVRASFRGVDVCGPNGETKRVQFFSGAHTQLEWQCVEFVMRYLYLAFNTQPYPGNGNRVFTNYPGTSGIVLRKIQNLTPGEYPQPGDVISFGGGTYGHAAIVIESVVDSSGNGYYRTLNQNWSSQPPVKRYSINQWDAHAIGWLRDPAVDIPALAPATQDNELTQDVNGDGRADVLAVLAENERFVTWQSSGTAFFSGIEAYSGANDYALDEFYLADVNGDAISDLIGIRKDEEQFVVWPSSGSSFGSPQEWLNDPYNYENTEFRVADVTGDGKADVVGIQKSDERFIVWPSQGNRFGGGVEWLDDPYNYENAEFQVADVTGDGKADVVGIQKSDERFIVWPSQGNRFGGGVEWLNDPYNYENAEFQVADVTGDGKADVVGIQKSDERFIVWPSQGNRFGGGVEWLNDPYSYPGYHFELADVNGDGKADIVGFYEDDERFIVWPSNGISFGGGQEWENGPYNYVDSDLHTGDINGDGKADVVGVHKIDKRIVAWLSNGNDFYSGEEWYNNTSNFSGYEIRAGDVNGDEKTDVLGIRKDEEKFIVWLSQGNSFAEPVEWLNGPYNYGNAEFRVADVTGDGKADVVGIQKSDERFIVWPSQGNRFGGGVEWLNDPYNYENAEFRVADVTGDGKADVVGIQKSDERFIVWPSQGNRFGGGVEWLDDPYNYMAYEFGLADANGDGKADVVGIRKDEERFIVWLSQGTNFGGGVEWQNGPYSYMGYEFRLADVNADGKADVLGISKSDERYVIWLSSGNSFLGGAEWQNGPYDYSLYRY